MQYAKKTAKFDAQTQSDVKELLTIINQSANPNKTVQLAAALIKKIVDARLTPAELSQVKGKAEEIMGRHKQG